MSSCKEAPLDIRAAIEICDSIGKVTSDSLIPILQQVQQTYGYLPPEVLMAVSKHTQIPASQIYGVATFYEQFHFEPHGRHTIKCCRGTACHVKDGPDILNAIKRALGIKPGETTDDMRFTFETVACLGTCFLAPVMMVNNDYYGHLTANKVKGILESYT